MSLQHVLPDVLYALLHMPAGLLSQIERALVYLSGNVQRAHPERDRLKGRLKLGL